MNTSGRTLLQHGGGLRRRWHGVPSTVTRGSLGSDYYCDLDYLGDVALLAWKNSTLWRSSRLMARGRFPTVLIKSDMSSILAKTFPPVLHHCFLIRRILSSLNAF